MKYATMSQFTKIIGYTVPALVEMGTPTCAPCKAMEPILEKVQEQYGSRLTVAKVDVSKERELAKLYHVATVPMLILFKDGSPVKSVLGFKTFSDVRKMLQGVVE
jgi:thioredoxin 1